MDKCIQFVCDEDYNLSMLDSYEVLQNEEEAPLYSDDSRSSIESLDFGLTNDASAE